MTPYRFPYNHKISIHKDPLLRFKDAPLLDVSLKDRKTGNLTKVTAFIDTGAQWCLFDKQYAYRLGIKNYMAGKKYEVGGIGGTHENTAYFHDLTLVVYTDQTLQINKSIQINTKVGFLEKEFGYGGILGVYGFLDHFTFFVNIPERYFEIEDV